MKNKKEGVVKTPFNAKDSVTKMSGPALWECKWEQRDKHPGLSLHPVQVSVRTKLWQWLSCRAPKTGASKRFSPFNCSQFRFEIGIFITLIHR